MCNTNYCWSNSQDLGLNSKNVLLLHFADRHIFYFATVFPLYKTMEMEMRICIAVFQHSLSCMQKWCLNAHLQNTVPFYFRSSQFYISSIKSLSFLYPLTLNYTCTYNSETLNKKKIPLKLESHLSLFINYTFYWSY